MTFTALRVRTVLLCPGEFCTEPTATCGCSQAPNGSSCSTSPTDCVTGETCLSGSCQAGSSVLCPSCNGCSNADTCNTVRSVATHILASHLCCLRFDLLSIADSHRSFRGITTQITSGTCDDGDQCTVDEYCTGGVCGNGQLVKACNSDDETTDGVHDGSSVPVLPIAAAASVIGMAIIAGAFALHRHARNAARGTETATLQQPRQRRASASRERNARQLHAGDQSTAAGSRTAYAKSMDLSSTGSP